MTLIYEMISACNAHKSKIILKVTSFESMNYSHPQFHNTE